MGDPLAFGTALVLLLFAPGPTNTVIAAAGATRSGRPWALLLAELAGYAGIVGLSRLVLLPLVAMWPVFGTAIKVVVIGYLLFAAFRMWRSRLTISADTSSGVRLVFVTTLLNPKGLVLALSVIPWEHPWLAMYLLAFAAIVLGSGWIWLAGGRLLAALAGRRARLLPRAAAIALLGFAALLAVSVGR